MMRAFSINGVTVGEAAPAFIIAEAGDNHMGCVETAKEMASLAKMAGADAIKFQHHLPEQEMLSDVPMSDNMREPLFDFLKRNALAVEDHASIKQHCDSLGIQYLCTPFSYAAALELEDRNLLDAIKIGSGEMTDIPSLKKMAEFGHPMIVSTGMCTFDEIDETYEVLCDCGIDFALMNCVSEYPPDYEDINLGTIDEMLVRYPRAVIGQSDHTPTNYTCFGALVKGVKLIEKHVIIDKLTPGPDQAVSLEFAEFHDLVKGVRILEAASGNQKQVHKKERAIRDWAFRSIVSTRHIKAGESISEGDVWSKRPGTGIPSKRMVEIIGATAIKDIPENTLLSWDQIECP